MHVKDFAALIRAFANLRARRHARLLILGEGELRGELERLASDLGVAEDVGMPGFYANPYALMSRASVFVQSSQWEGLPSVLVEAMACGTPVVATDCPGGTREILEDGRLGTLVPVERRPRAGRCNPPYPGQAGQGQRDGAQSRGIHA